MVTTVAYTRIVDVQVGDGEVIQAEVSTGGGGDAGAAWDKLRLDDAADAVRRVGRWVVDTVRDGLPEKPSKVGVEFGLKLAVKSGKLTSVLAEASGEASLVVKLEWTSDGQ